MLPNPGQEFAAGQDRVHPCFDSAKTPLGGLSLFQPDWMHCKCLGTDASLVGSALGFMATEILPGSAEQNMAFMWEEIQKYYSLHKTKCRLSNLTWNMVKHQPFYRLSAKAVETRDLIPALAAFLGQWSGNVIVAWFQRLLLLSSKLDELVFSNPNMWLSAVERQQLKEGIFDFNQMLSKMSWHFLQLGKPFCNFTIKNHYLCHIGINAAKSGISPRVAFCFQGEDFMSLIKTLAVASGRGVSSAKLIDKVVEKYLRGLDLLLGI